MLANQFSKPFTVQGHISSSWSKLLRVTQLLSSPPKFIPYIPLANLSGLISTPMILEAPTSLQPITAASPTPPSPQTATLDPGSTLG